MRCSDVKSSRRVLCREPCGAAAKRFLCVSAGCLGRGSQYIFFGVLPEYWPVVAER